MQKRRRRPIFLFFFPDRKGDRLFTGALSICHSYFLSILSFLVPKVGTSPHPWPHIPPFLTSSAPPSKWKIRNLNRLELRTKKPHRPFISTSPPPFLNESFSRSLLSFESIGDCRLSAQLFEVWMA
jgi:hypothetical protein